MNGVQLVSLLDVLNVNAIEEAVGVSPRSIIVKGEDFRSVERVLINGLESPEFVVYSERELVAEVPEPIRDAIITDVAVFSANLTFTERSLVEFTVGTRVKKVRGPLRLMQTFLRILLRTPGSNIFHKRSGGGLVRRVGDVVNNRAVADVAVAVNLAKQYIISAQTPHRNIPPSERLLSAEIIGMTPDPANASLFVTIVLMSHSGRRAAATLIA